MAWLKDGVGALLSGLGLDTASRWGGTLRFFLYDIIKIFLLLSVLIFIISYIQSYFPPERTRRILGRVHGLPANILSALLGTVTPFCSCSSIPIFMGFTSAGLPLGVTFSFLISSPMVDLGSLVLLMSVFGGKVAVFYVLFGLAVAVAGGTVIEKLGLEEDVADYIRSAPLAEGDGPRLTPRDRMSYAGEQVARTIRKVWIYVLVGVGVGAVIHNWIPANVIQAVLGENNPLSVVLATLVGIPMYADIFGTIPIAEALYAKGVGLGTILSFMMAVTTLSLPSLIMLSRVVKRRLLGVFVGICTFGIILVGYLFNAAQYLFI